MDKVIEIKIKKMLLLILLLTIVFSIFIIYGIKTSGIFKIILLFLGLLAYLLYQVFNIYDLYKNNKIIEYEAICVDVKKAISRRKYSNIVFYVKKENNEAELVTIQRSKEEHFVKDKAYLLYFIKDKPLNSNNFIGLSLGEFKE